MTLDGDGYDDEYVTELKTIVGALTANGVKVILTPMDTPEWASDRKVWKGGYSPNYPPAMGDAAVRGQFGRMAAFLASEFGDRARYLEVWNEPNMGGALYPQTRPGDSVLRGTRLPDDAQDVLHGRQGCQSSRGRDRGGHCSARRE